MLTYIYFQEKISHSVEVHFGVVVEGSEMYSISMNLLVKFDFISFFCL